MYCASATAALRFLEYLETIQMPPPTSPVVVGVVCPAQVSGAAAATSPAGTCRAALKMYWPYQDGPMSISVLAAYCLTNESAKADWVVSDLLATPASSRLAILVQLELPVSTETLLPVIRLAGHWLAQKWI